MTRDEAKARIEEIGILPGVRVGSAADALFAAETLYQAGIPIAEITMTTPGAIGVIKQLALRLPDMIVGAGTVLDTETARKCVDAGAKFLTSTGLVPEVVSFAPMGGDQYIRSLKLPLPQVLLIAAGGVNQNTAVDFIRAGSSAIGVGSELLPKDAVRRRQDQRIHELARRFLGFVAEARVTVLPH